MDPVLVVIVIVIVMPLAVIFALAKASSMRGPTVRPESRRPVGSLVTEVIPEERAEDENAVGDGAASPDVGATAPRPDDSTRETR